MNQLEQLNLTEQDFQLIIEGLDQLPNKGDMGTMMGSLFLGAMMKDDSEEEKRKVKAKMEEIDNQRKREKTGMIEDVRILQGKLLQLKRYLMEQGALKQTYEIINKDYKD